MLKISLFKYRYGWRTFIKMVDELLSKLSKEIQSYDSSYLKLRIWPIYLGSTSREPIEFLFIILSFLLVSMQVVLASPQFHLTPPQFQLI